MAYSIVNPHAGYVAIAVIDTGVTLGTNYSNGGSSTPTPPNFLGTVVRAVDPVYGSGEFIFLAGVANTAVGSVVTYNTTSYTTALAPVGANKPQPIAIAMSANNLATTYGWYQISGMAVAAKTSGVAVASAAAVGVQSVGLINATAAGKEIEGAFTAAKATTPKTVTLVINRPVMQGRIS